MANQEHLDILTQGVEAWNQWRQEHPEVRPNLEGAKLRQANLISAYLTRADLGGADCSRANFEDASLGGADFAHANLTGANLRGADLVDAYLFNTNLTEANLGQAKIFGTTFGYIDLRHTKGLDDVDHFGPSSIGIDTIIRSEGKISETFLRGAGVPDSFITYAHSLITHPIDYYTCFISYSSKDEGFVALLYADLQNKGVRCWFAPEDLKWGDKIRPRIDESIRLYDKLLLVLSQHSVASQWVEQEVETALEKERKEGCTVLFPIRLDKTVMDIEGGWPALIRNTRNIGDFTRLKRHDAYQKALERLLRDLKAEASKPEV